MVFTRCSLRIVAIYLLVALWSGGAHAVRALSTSTAVQTTATAGAQPSQLELEKLQVEKERLSLERARFDYDKKARTWEFTEKFLGAIHYFVATAALLAGGIWAYFKFVRYRTLKPRLEFSFDWELLDQDYSCLLAILRLKLANMGQTKIALRKKNRHRCFLKYALITEALSLSQQPISLLTVPAQRLQHIDTVFAAHGWIEPGETIDDVKVLTIEKKKLLAVQFEVLAFGARKWSASAAFPLIGSSVGDSCDSEDEQDEYEEAEAIEEGLRSVLARARRLSEVERLPLEDLIHEIEALLRSVNMGRAFVRNGERLIDKAEQCLRSIK